MTMKRKIIPKKERVSEREREKKATNRNDIETFILAECLLCFESRRRPASERRKRKKLDIATLHAEPFAANLLFSFQLLVFLSRF